MQPPVTQFNKGQRVLPAKGNRSAFSNRWGSYVTANCRCRSQRGKRAAPCASHCGGLSAGQTCTAKTAGSCWVVAVYEAHHQANAKRASVRYACKRRYDSRVTRDCLDTDHVDHLRVYGLCDDVPVVGDVLHHLAQRRPLHLLPFQVAQRVRDEVKEDAALPQLLDEQLLLLRRGNVWKWEGGGGGGGWGSGIEAGSQKRKNQKTV